MSPAVARAHPMAAFAEAQHQRDGHGRFATMDSRDAKPGPKVVSLAERRSLATLPGYYRRASAIPGLPVAYTGSPHKERAVAAYEMQELADQRPTKMPVAEHEARKARIKKLIIEQAPGTIERGFEPIRRGKLKGTTLIPTGTPIPTVERAYTHAAMLAMHGFGTHRYDWKMPPALQEELTPLVPFIRYAQRRLLNTMLGTEKGQWKPYRAAFGEPFADNRRDKVTGAVRLRMSPRQQIIKAAPMGALAKAFDESKHARAIDGTFFATKPTYDINRGTTELGMRDVVRGWRHIPDHFSDVWNARTAVGSKPTGKQLRRQFARDSFFNRERMILTDRNGRVTHSVTGSAEGVGIPQSADVRIRMGKAGRMMHSHPIDAVPSVGDAAVAYRYSRMAPRPLVQLVYGFGRTQDGKTRVRVTRYDHMPVEKYREGKLSDPKYRGDFSPKKTVRYFLQRSDLQDKDWAGAAGSKYRTKAVEKAAPMGALAKAFEESKHDRAEDGRFTAGTAVKVAAGTAAGAAATAGVGIPIAARMHDHAKSTYAGKYRAAAKGKRVVWRGAPSGEPALRWNPTRTYVANQRPLASLFARRGRNVVHRYVLDEGAEIAPLHSRKAARVFAARGNLLSRKFEPHQEADGYRVNIGMKPKHHSAEEVKSLFGRSGDAVRGRPSMWMADKKQKKMAARLGVAGVEAPEFKRGDTSVIFDLSRLKHIGFAQRPGAPSLAARLGAMSSEIMHSLHKGAVTFDESKHARSHGGEFAASAEASSPDQNLQLGAGAAGGAAAAFTGSRAAKKSVRRAGDVLGRRTAAGIRMGVRKLGGMQIPEVAAVVRDQSRIVGNFVGRQTSKRLGFGVALGAGLLGNYGGELIARRASGATGKDDAYQGATLGGFAAGALGIALGHKAGIGRFSRFTKPARLLGRLGKSFEEGKHKRAHDGQFASGTGEAAPATHGASALAQPTQLLGGALGAAAAVHAAGHFADKPAARAAVGAQHAASSSFLRFASDARATSNPHSAKLVHLQAQGIGHAAHFGVRGAVAAAIGVGAGLGGDLIGDWAARKATGASGHEDEYRHASVIGMGTGMLGAMLGQMHGGSKRYRTLRYSPKLRAARGLGGAVAGSIAAEVAGNVVDEKAGATDLMSGASNMLAGVNRRTSVRLGQVGKSARMGTLAKG